MDRKRWITCGVIAVVLACIGLIGFGGLAAITAWFSEPTPAGGGTTSFLVTDTPSTLNLIQDPTTAPSAPTSLPLVKGIPYEAVVQIIALYYEGSQLEVGWTGSGSIISPDGLILTNAHVVLPDRYFPVDALAVAFTLAEDQPPEIQYFAEVLQADAALDIAVIGITADLDGNPINQADLDLPYVPMGDADDLRLGDGITILGYPGIGGQTITLTRGEVSGFTSEQGRGARAFIKTSATIAGGNSGGLAADSQGYLIGIPTQLGYGGDDQYVDCRVLVDTNRDGIVDDRDSCVPTGGFINALRPINLALPLIDAASQGRVTIHKETAPGTEPVEVPASGQVLFSDDFSDQDTGWAWSGTDGSISYGNGGLEFKVLSPEVFVYATSGGGYTDVIVEADTYVLQAAGDSDFGLICRYVDSNNFYGLEISEDGYYSIWKFVNGEYFDLVEWQPTTLIDTSRVMKITASCVGEKFSLILDGQLLAEARDSDLTSGDAGLMAGTWEITPVVIWFDNLVIRQAGN
ncbi:MAG: trypsin-like peptidase domain-containing protein [Anaerolineales bacterium]|nr:trypsin-like peptidase domain-containing protein [Anaerolineales bacterium]